MKLTDEQIAAIQCSEHEFIVSACAGSGKTSTLVHYAAARPKEQFLYLAFNRAIKEEAERKFGPNTRCVTTHGLAYGAFGKHFRAKLGNPKPYHIASALQLSMLEAANVLETLNSYFRSADRELGDQHAPTSDPEQARHWVRLATKAKALMEDPTNQEVPHAHDCYLKMFQVNGGQIKADCILFDEFQDANDVTKSIVQQQRARKIYVGDARQSIYAFRGATNTMDKMRSVKHLHLTASFRFGDGVAAVANAVLGAYQDHPQKIRGLGAERTVFAVDRSRPHTVLCRTNGMLFMEVVSLMVRNIPFYLVGGVKNYRFDNVLDAYWLRHGERGKIKDKFIASFDDFEIMESYAKSVDDKEIKFLARCVTEYGKRIPGLITDIQKKALDAPSGNEVTLTTGHRSKGLEWMDVVLADDFTDMRTSFDPAAGQEVEPDIQEINLLYVALTRAQRGLEIPKGIKEWLAEHCPKEWDMVRTRDRAGNTNLPSLLGDDDGVAQTQTQTQAADAAEEQTFSNAEFALLDVLLVESKDTTRKRYFEKHARSLSEEASECRKGNPSRANLLDTCSGLLAAVAKGRLVLSQEGKNTVEQLLLHAKP